MVIAVNDIRRAWWGRGDISAYASLWQRALGLSSFPDISTLGEPVNLPGTTQLLACLDEELAVLTAAWVEGADTRRPSGEDRFDLTLISLAPHGRNIGAYLERVIDEVAPDIIVLDIPPLEMSAAMLYALSLPAALGLPLSGDIIARDFSQFYKREAFYPGGMKETAIIKSWLARKPLLPVGVPRLRSGYSDLDFTVVYTDPARIEQGMSQVRVLTAYRALDEGLGRDTGLSAGLEIIKDVSGVLLAGTDARMREKLVDESVYIASRIMEIAAVRRGQVLAVVDISHYHDIEYVLGLLKQGVTEELYLPPKSYVTAGEMLMVSGSPEEPDNGGDGFAPDTSLAQEFFQSELERFNRDVDGRELAPTEADELVARIVRRTRRHPNIIRGASVRGAIALKEVLHGYGEMHSGLSRESINRAALVALPPRITVRPGEDKAALIDDILKEEFYGFRFSGIGGEDLTASSLKQLSLEDIVSGLENLKPLTVGEKERRDRSGRPAVIPGENRPEGLRTVDLSHLRKRSHGQQDFMRKALEYLTEELERKLREGEITQSEYNQRKGQLETTLGALSSRDNRLSSREMAETIMELMDAQDRQRGSELSFERMHIYYHLRANTGDDELLPQKHDYYGLKMLVDDLVGEGILGASANGMGLTLTPQALDVLLDYLVLGETSGRRLRDTVVSGKSPADERKTEVRRYSSGDIFRDISVRHTLKEVSRQRKVLADVRQSDFRVFMKEHQKLQSDIVICMDASGSMGFRQKLIHARLAAAGLAQAALAEGDRVGIVAFNDVGQTAIPLTDGDEEAILGCITGLAAKSNTNIGDGIRCSAELLFRDRNRNQKRIVLITDGQATAVSEETFGRLKEIEEGDMTEESAIMETRKAAARGVQVSVIYIVDEHEEGSGLVKRIAEIGRGKLCRVDRSTDLRSVLR